MLEALLKIFVVVERKENDWDIPTQLGPDNNTFLVKNKKDKSYPIFLPSINLFPTEQHTRTLALKM